MSKRSEPVRTCAAILLAVFSLGVEVTSGSEEREEILATAVLDSVFDQAVLASNGAAVRRHAATLDDG